MAYSKTGDGYVGANQIYAGRLLNGTVTITSGLYAVQAFDSGAPIGAAPTTGTITLTGPTTDVTVEDPGNAGFPASINVGRNFSGGTGVGTGYLNILAGATLTSINEGYDVGGYIVGGYGNVNIGRGAGSYGKATVSGIGSKLLAYGGAARVTVGRDGGTGELRIENGGFVGTFDLDVGRGGAGTIGRLIIDGAGSTFLASAAYGFYGTAYAGAQGFLDIGRGTAGKGYLTVSAGGTFTTQNVDLVSDHPLLRFGRDNGSYGYGYVSGHDGTYTTYSTINVTQNGPQGDNYNGGAILLVGDGGQGVLKVANGGQVNVTGDRARLIVADGRYVGGVPDNTAYQSHLYIQSGADVVVDSQGYGGGDRGAKVFIGSGRDTNGALTVDGAGSTLTVTSSTNYYGDYQNSTLTVGRLGTGVLNVSNGGAVSARQLNVGQQAATVDAYTGQTTYTTSGYLASPDAAGYGTVNIASGGTVTITNSDYTPYQGVRIGRASSTTGIVNIDGAGSTLTSQGGSGMIRVGRYGTGELNISNGGAVNAFFVDVGRNNGSNGRLTV
ncbi:MAG: beta strand repeat-containing protein, partial [Paracoccaceae bacterium]